MQVTKSRGLVLVVLIVFGINGFTWTFNAEVLSQSLIHHDLSSISAEDSPGHTSDASPSDQANCNHGCHALCHLQTYVCAGVSVASPERDNAFEVERVAIHLHNVPDTQERPPRISFAV